MPISAHAVVGATGKMTETAPSFSAAMPRVVAIGGGTGLPILLQGLKAAFFPPGCRWLPTRDGDRITAIVTVADDGGSSGCLRRDYHVLPPGDIRNCLLALADGDPTMTEVFNFRFNGNGALGGHSLGNLILTALNQLEGDFPAVVERASEMLAVRGRIFPSTRQDVTLIAEFVDGSHVEGESLIASAQRPIHRIRLQHEEVRTLPEVHQAIGAADLIVIGPGSLYTSVIPVLLVKGIADAIARSKARVVLVMNLMTERGETDGYTAVDHLLAIRRHAPQLPIHDVLLNTTPIPGETMERYAVESAVLVPDEIALLRALGCRPVERDLLGVGSKVRHDPDKLARAVLELVMEESDE